MNDIVYTFIYTLIQVQLAKRKKNVAEIKQKAVQDGLLNSIYFNDLSFHRILSEDSKAVTTLWFYCAINTGAANYYQIDFPSNGCSSKQPEQRQKCCVKVLHTLISCLQLINYFNENLFKACSWTILFIRQSQHIMKQI